MKNYNVNSIFSHVNLLLIMVTLSYLFGEKLLELVDVGSNLSAFGLGYIYVIAMIAIFKSFKRMKTRTANFTACSTEKDD